MRSMSDAVVMLLCFGPFVTVCGFLLLMAWIDECVWKRKVRDMHRRFAEHRVRKTLDRTMAMLALATVIVVALIVLIDMLTHYT